MDHIAFFFQFVNSKEQFLFSQNFIRFIALPCKLSNKTLKCLLCSSNSNTSHKEDHFAFLFPQTASFTNKIKSHRKKNGVKK